MEELDWFDVDAAPIPNFAWPEFWLDAPKPNAGAGAAAAPNPKAGADVLVPPKLKEDADDPKLFLSIIV